MRFVIQLALATIIGVAAIFAIANRTETNVDFYPFPFTAEIPLYVIILGAISIGLIIGVALSSISRFRLRLEAEKHRKRAEALEMVSKEKVGSNTTPHAIKREQNNRLALDQD
ncbi:MAG: hypothetical protein CMM75_02020 [Rhodospirillaceae bacterium]|nr:hypothetical protein [Rhodospirillaceae bacterium]|tara:strand:+ start:338 stop:676 length:339 start_codon:yes stop_codon:yes gene_type:complete